MHFLILMLLQFPLLHVSAFSQHTDRDNTMVNGIFVTPQDLATTNVLEANKTDNLNNVVVNLDKNVLLIRSGFERKYKFGTLSGYYKDGYRYRAYGKQSIFATFGYYKVLDDAGLIVYSKRSSNNKSGGKTFYYYSTSLDAPLRKLTKANLKKDFAQDTAFVEAASDALDNQLFLSERNGRTLLNDLYLTRGK